MLFSLLPYQVAFEDTFIDPFFFGWELAGLVQIHYCCIFCSFGVLEIAKSRRSGQDRLRHYRLFSYIRHPLDNLTSLFELVTENAQCVDALSCKFGAFSGITFI